LGNIWCPFLNRFSTNCFTKSPCLKLHQLPNDMARNWFWDQQSSNWQWHSLATRNNAPAKSTFLRLQRLIPSMENWTRWYRPQKRSGRTEGWWAMRKPSHLSWVCNSEDLIHFIAPFENQKRKRQLNSWSVLEWRVLQISKQALTPAGMTKKLFAGASLSGNCKFIFLDEPLVYTRHCHGKCINSIHQRVSSTEHSSSFTSHQASDNRDLKITLSYSPTTARYVINSAHSHSCW